MLEPSDIQQIRLAVRDEIAAPHVTEAILTTEEAYVYVKAKSTSAFYRWAKAWGVRSTNNGRYSRRELDAALAREGMSGRYVKREKVAA